jgi:hypothetical protein
VENHGGAYVGIRLMAKIMALIWWVQKTLTLNATPSIQMIGMWHYWMMPVDMLLEKQSRD